MDLLITNARVWDDRPPVDIGIEGERIAAIEPRIDADAGRTIDAGGRAVLPGFVEPHLHLDAVRPQHGKAAPSDQRERILHRRHDAPDAGRDDALGARTGASGMRARFERAVQRGAAGGVARFVQRMDLGVRLAGALVRALPHHDAVVRHHARADERIGRGAPQSSAGMLDRPPHPSLVVYHFA